MARLSAWFVVVTLAGCGAPAVVVVRDQRALEEWPPVDAVAPAPRGEAPRLGRPRPLIRPGSVALEQ